MCLKNFYKGSTVSVRVRDGLQKNANFVNFLQRNIVVFNNVINISFSMPLSRKILTKTETEKCLILGK